MRIPTMMAPLLAAALLAVPGRLPGGDWPQFRFDEKRSGYTPDGIPADLGLYWVFRPQDPPHPAWRGEDTRMPFDHAPMTVVAKGQVFFGSTVDCKVYALDAATGRTRWTYFTEGPVRFAPAFSRDRLYVASDDGHLYCLDATTGRLLWRMMGGPAPDMLLGNGRMISRWPARGAPVIAGGVLYFAAGIWPSEGIHIHALDPETGRSLWVNDTAGGIEMDQPHPTARAKSGVSVQGYPAVSDDTLVVPTGRATPAAFDRADGRFRYFHLQAYSGKGASPFITLIDGITLNHKNIFRTRDGVLLTRGIPGSAVAALPDLVVYAQGTEILASSRKEILVEKEVVDRDGKKAKTLAVGDPLWRIPCPEPLGPSLIAAGSTIVAGTKSNKLLTADMDRRSIVATLAVDGLPLGLAVSDERLFVSTDRGSIYCFGPKPAPEPVRTGPERRPEPSGKSGMFALAAESILSRTGVTSGYCLDIACGDGSLAWELARRSELHIYAIDPDGNLVRAARRKLDAAGLYGRRVTVLERRLDDTGMPNYFADLVVSQLSLKDGHGALPRQEIERLTRPSGGTTFLGPLDAPVVSVRGDLPGAGMWTHLYADPANTACSDDAVVKGPLGMLWFTDNDLEMPSRHGRGPSPLYAGGRLFVQGIHALRALDAYNGRTIWTLPMADIAKTYDQEHLNGAAITGNNYCLGGDSIYLRLENRCLRLDAATGRKRVEFEAPALPDGRIAPWGYIAWNRGTLFGSLYDTSHIVTFAFGRADMSRQHSESSLLFALDAESGRLKWSFPPENSIRNNAIAIGKGRVFLIDRPLALRDRKKEDSTEHPPGTLVALDEETGKVVWRQTKDIYGTCLSLSEKHDVLLMAYQPTAFRLASEAGGRMAAFRSSDGKRLWDVKAAYESRPIMNNRTIYAQPGAWDLLTGAQLDFHLSRSYGCGIPSGSRYLLAYRSATIGYHDLTRSIGTEDYGGIRPGCWINCLPVGGLLLVPEASNRCVCSYPLKATIALEPYGLRPPAIEPPGGTFNRPVAAWISSDTGEAAVRYTLDGSSPSVSSKRYTSPLRIDRTTTVRARAFRAGQPPSPVTEARFVIDPQAIPLEKDAWQIHDAPGANPARSRWIVENGIAREESNIFKGAAGDADPATERPGTLRIYVPPAAMADGELSLRLSSADDDGLGIAFRMTDPEQYYLWAMDRQRGFHILALKKNDAYRVLSSNRNGYVPNRWYDLRIVLQGPSMRVYIDGELDLEATDRTFQKGTFALYAWGCTGAKFRDVRWVAR